MFLIPGFGDRLISERKRLEYTQKEFASLLNLGALVVHQYEKEKTTPQIKLLFSLQNNGADIQYLLSGIRMQQHDKSREKLPQEYVIWIATIVDIIEKDIAPKSLATEGKVNLIIILIEFLLNISSVTATSSEAASSSGTWESLLTELAMPNDKIINDNYLKDVL